MVRCGTYFQEADRYVKDMTEAYEQAVKDNTMALAMFAHAVYRVTKYSILELCNLTNISVTPNETMLKSHWNKLCNQQAVTDKRVVIPMHKCIATIESFANYENYGALVGDTDRINTLFHAVNELVLYTNLRTQVGMRLESAQYHLQSIRRGTDNKVECVDDISRVFSSMHLYNAIKESLSTLVMIETQQTTVQGSVSDLLLNIPAFKLPKWFTVIYDNRLLLNRFSNSSIDTFPVVDDADLEYLTTAAVQLYKYVKCARYGMAEWERELIRYTIDSGGEKQEVERAIDVAGYNESTVEYDINVIMDAVDRVIGKKPLITGITT